MADCTTETVRLLAISRGPTFLRPLCSVAEANSWHVETAVSPWDAMERVQSGVAPHLLLLDLPRGDEDGLHILRWLRRLRPDLPVIVVCFPEDASHELEAMCLGAREILVRPFDEATLESSIYRQLVAPGNGEEEAGSDDVEELGPDSFLVSASPATRKLRAQARLLAEADVPVLILGEPGSGKESVARLIHKLSLRSGFKFLKVNCADMPGDLLSTELFGPDGSSSPDGGVRVAGKFERAEKGTLFIDEVAEMPLGIQGKLLQVLHERIQRKAGSDTPVDVRVMAASSASIDRALTERKLREDLYYRLSAFTVHVPPLRQRKSEIVVLLRHSMHQLAKQYGLPEREFSSAALDACQNYSWPGNLKQLENFVKRYLVAGDKELNLGEAGPVHAGEKRHLSQPQATWLAGETGNEEGECDRSLKALIRTVKSEAERNAIASALEKTGWNRKAAARMLRVSYRTLLYKIEQYHMTASESFLSPLPRGKFPSHGGSPSKGGG